MLNMFSSDSYFNYASGIYSKIKIDAENPNTTSAQSFWNSASLIPATLAEMAGSVLWLAKTIATNPHIQELEELENREDEELENRIKIQPHLPNMEDIRSVSLKTLHRQWKTNNEILIGILSCEIIPHIGFHGTNKDGLEGIMESKKSDLRNYKSDDWIYVASYTDQLDPITFLADLYTCAYKALGYMEENGGIFTVRTKCNSSMHKYIWTISNSFPDCKDHDSYEEKKFLQLINRKKSDEGDGDFDDTRNISISLCSKHNKPLIKTKHFFTACEFKLKFDPENYEKKILGVLKDNERVYSRKHLKNLYHSFYSLDPDTLQEYNYRYNLAKRFEMQEIIFKAFLHANIIDHENSHSSLLAEQQKGEELMQQFKQITKIKNDGKPYKLFMNIIFDSVKNKRIAEKRKKEHQHTLVK